MAELLDVFDKNNKPLGLQKERAVIRASKDKGWFRRTVHLLIVNDDGKILGCWRSRHKSNGPRIFCNACAGHVDAGESYDVAAERELMEELGVQSVLRPLGVFTDVEDFAHMAFYVAHHNGPFSGWEAEAEALEWFDADEVLTLKDRFPYLVSDGFAMSVRVLKSENNPSE